MKRLLLIAVGLLGAAMSAPGFIIINQGGQLQTPQIQPLLLSGQGLLRWRNGEMLPGELAGASPAALNWKSPLFDDPLQIAWPVIDQIVWATPRKPATPTAPFSIALRDGSFIYGDLVSITADTVTIHDPRHGEAALRRADVLAIRRLHQGPLLYAGPTGRAGWQGLMENGQPDSNNQQQNGGDMPDIMPTAAEMAPALMTGPGGSLQIRAFNRCARLTTLSQSVSYDVTFRVRSTQQPQFRLALGGNSNIALRVETWDGDLVLSLNNQFKFIRRLGPEEREVALRVCFNKETRQCSVYSPEGEHLLDWQPTGNVDRDNPGILLHNKGLDLTLESLIVRSWNGKPPEGFATGKPHLELVDGRMPSGSVVTGSNGSIKLQGDGQAVPADFTLADVTAIVFSSAAPESVSPPIMLRYFDGAFVNGTLDSCADGKLQVATSFMAAPLTCQVDGLQQLQVRPAKEPPVLPALDTLDKITIQNTTLHGKLGTVGDDRVRWTPVGGLGAARPSSVLQVEITRMAGEVKQPDPDLIYLNSGDVLPGKVGGVDAGGIDFTSTLLDTKKMPAEVLNAVVFDAAGMKPVQGFDDPGWRVTKGNAKDIQHDKNRITLAPDTALGHPDAMRNGEITFNYENTGFSGARLRLFCAGTDDSHSINVMLGQTGNQFVAGLETGPGQMQDQFQIRTTLNAPVTVRIAIGERDVRIFANDMQVLQVPIDSVKAPGSGLIIEPGGLWGNMLRPITLSNFSAKPLPGRSWAPALNEDVREQVLTVPRFQKNDPPRHILLAPNGDVLRGEVEAATNEHFRFRCGLEELNVPRDRVKAVVWPRPISKDAKAEPPVPKAPDPLDARIDRRVGYMNTGLRQLVSFLEQPPMSLKIQVNGPINNSQRATMQFGNQTIRDALAQICSLFNYQYHIDPTGTIVLEPTAAPDTSMLSQAFWVKPGALPGTGTAQEFLTGKGITFPPHASASWQPAAGLLAMTNTAENQAKLKTLLDSDFGGPLGRPSCWLTLSSGARLALEVKKFEKDAIVGRNPVYGDCRVPLADVCVLRTQMPAASTAVQAFSDWQLVPAPEPVIPGTNDEQSQLLGKDAPTFSLPLLDGGNFDLASEKGHVIVLDFWATWCAPCVRSLPGLVETMSAFPADKVKLIGVNQGESPEMVKRFLKAKDLKLTVAMDGDQSVGAKYGSDSIPFTVIIGPDGKIAWTQTGFSEDAESEAAAVVKHLLETPAAAKP